MIVYEKLHSVKMKTDGSEMNNIEVFTQDDGKENVYIHIIKMNGETTKFSLDKINAIKFSLRLVGLLNKV